MVAIITILLYVFIVTIPFNLVGIFNTLKLVLDVIKIRSGYVETLILMEGGQTKTKLQKPESGAIKIGKDKPMTFKDSIGYIWRKGFKPFTIVREKDLTQLNLLSEGDIKGDVFGAKDKSNVVIRAYNEGYIDGFSKNKMMNNLILFVLIGIGVVGLLTFLTYTNTTNILGLLKE